MTAYRHVNWAYLASRVERIMREATGPGFDVVISPGRVGVAVVVTYTLTGETAVTQIDRDFLLAPRPVLRDELAPLAQEITAGLAYMNWHHGLAAGVELPEA